METETSQRVKTRTGGRFTSHLTPLRWTPRRPSGQILEAQFRNSEVQPRFRPSPAKTSYPKQVPLEGHFGTHLGNLRLGFDVLGLGFGAVVWIALDGLGFTASGLGSTDSGLGSVLSGLGSSPKRFPTGPKCPLAPQGAQRAPWPPRGPKGPWALGGGWGVLICTWLLGMCQWERPTGLRTAKGS